MGYPGGQSDKGRPSPPDPLEPVPAVPRTVNGGLPPPLRGASGRPLSLCPSGPPAYGAMLGAKGQVGSPHEGRRGYRGRSRRGGNGHGSPSAGQGERSPEAERIWHAGTNPRLQERCPRVLRRRSPREARVRPGLRYSGRPVRRAPPEPWASGRPLRRPTRL